MPQPNEPNEPNEPSFVSATRTAYSRSANHTRHLEQAYGHAISLDAYRRPPEQVAELLSEAGFAVHARMVRAPERSEKVDQAFLLARKER